MLTFAMLRAIAGKTRLSLLRLLIESDRSVLTLVRNTNKSQPAISIALKVLRDAGLVIVKKSGKQRIYAIDPKIKGKIIPIIKEVIDGSS